MSAVLRKVLLFSKFYLGWWNDTLKCHVSLVNVRLQRPIQGSTTKQSFEHQSDTWPAKAAVIPSISNSVINSTNKLKNNVFDRKPKSNYEYFEDETESVSSLTTEAGHTDFFTLGAPNTSISFSAIEKRTVTDPIRNMEIFAPVVQQPGHQQIQIRMGSLSQNENAISSKNYDNCINLCIRKLFCCCC